MVHAQFVSVMIKSCVTRVASSPPLSRWQLFKKACNLHRPFKTKRKIQHVALYSDKHCDFTALPCGKQTESFKWDLSIQTHSRPLASLTYLLHFLPGRQQSRHHLGTVIPPSTKSAVQTIVRPRSARTPRAIQHTAWSHHGKQHSQQNRRNGSRGGWTEKPGAVSSTKHSWACFPLRAPIFDSYI